MDSGPVATIGIHDNLRPKVRILHTVVCLANNVEFT